MAKLPAQCINPACRTIFPTGIEIVEGHTGSFEGNFFSCPRCGSMAQLADGVFTATDGFLKMLAGPARSRTLIEAFQGIAQAAADDRITQQQAIERAEELSTNLANLLRQAYRIGKPALSALAVAAGLWLAYKGYESDKDDDEVQRQLLAEVRAIHKTLDAHPTPPVRLPGLGGAPYSPIPPGRFKDKK